MLINFNADNRDDITKVLENHLQRGYMLSRINGFTGVLAFEPAPAEGVVYALIYPKQYVNKNLPKPWKKCGMLGEYQIWRSADLKAAVPKPDISLKEAERSQKTNYIIIAAIWLMQAVVYLSMDIPYIFSSARDFSENLNLLSLRGILCLITGIGNLGKAFKNKNAAAAKKRGYFGQFILPWVLCLLLTAFFIAAGFYCKGGSISLPDSRLPFSEEFDSGTFERSYAARRYEYHYALGDTYLGCFLYETDINGLAQKVMEEMREKWFSEQYSVYPMTAFLFKDLTAYDDLSDYPFLDEIFLCDGDTTDFGVTYKGVLVRSGDVIFGVWYKKDSVTESEILQYLNDFFAGS